MRWPAILGVFVLVAVGTGCSGKSKPKITTSGTATPPTTSGNLRLSSKATGKSFYRKVVVRVQDPKSGAPVRGAEVSVYGEMTSPHSMVLITKDLREVSRGTYARPYTFIMRGRWTVHITARSKKGIATSELPIRIGG